LAAEATDSGRKVEIPGTCHVNEAIRLNNVTAAQEKWRGITSDGIERIDSRLLPWQIVPLPKRKDRMNIGIARSRVGSPEPRFVAVREIPPELKKMGGRRDLSEARVSMRLLCSIMHLGWASLAS
jgi:hypothetical protein